MAGRKRNAGTSLAFGTRANGVSHVSNLTVEDIPGFAGEKNMSFTERAISTLIGFGLMAAAVQPRPNKVLSLLALLGGAGLAIRGATGHCPVKASLGQPGGAPRITHG